MLCAHGPPTQSSTHQQRPARRHDARRADRVPASFIDLAWRLTVVVPSCRRRSCPQIVAMAAAEDCGRLICRRSSTGLRYAALTRADSCGRVHLARGQPDGTERPFLHRDRSTAWCAAGARSLAAITSAARSGQRAVSVLADPVKLRTRRRLCVDSMAATCSCSDTSGSLAFSLARARRRCEGRRADDSFLAG